VHPDWKAGGPVPVVLWMHGRTANKELDPGRYLRLMRAGLGVCAVDLPGHGERSGEDAWQDGRRSVEMILQMADEIDQIVAAVGARDEFDGDRWGIGGMSAGGMAATARLSRPEPHPFRCVSLEATTGSWRTRRPPEPDVGEKQVLVEANDPVTHLDGWREIPVQAFHSRLDEIMPVESQVEFIDALRARYVDPGQIELVLFDETGAPAEHAGFGRLSAKVKNRQRDFFTRWLGDVQAT
jgi:pimeloyl-ACP methyl ester carboxylesterase